MKNARHEKSSFRRMLADKAVVNDLRELFAAEDELESLTPGGGAIGEADIEGVLSDGAIDQHGFTEVEAIILAKGRPALLIKDGVYEPPEIPEIKRRMNPHRDTILSVIPSVARVELLHHPNFSFVGTAWMVADDVMITNRHVANIFALNAGGHFQFRTDPLGRAYGTQVDFKEEHGSTKAFELKVIDILHIENDTQVSPDMALIRVEQHPKLPPPILLATSDAQFDDDIAVIGYPAIDSRNDAFVMRDIFKDIYDVKRIAPGRVAGVRPDGAVLMHDCTTLGGNSGSVVFRMETGEAVGLHFAGSFLENNFAVTASVLLRRMQELENQIAVQVPIDVTAAAVDIEVPRPKPTVADMDDRIGYDPDFLLERILLPDVSDELAEKITPVEGNDEDILDYIHYSVVMHNERCMALYTVSNIDGKKMRRVHRTRDKWHYDPRMSEELQAGQALYSSNNLHRGHLVRRLDPSWGNLSVAEAAVADTFFWTNCTPQHERFNPRSWLRLEDYVLENAENHDMKVSVFTGPIFSDSDPKYRGFQIPESYWKVIAFDNAQRSEVSATAYIVSQADFTDDLEFAFGEFRTFQVPIKEVESRTGLDFGHLADRDPLGRIETAPRIELHMSDEAIL